MVLNGVAISEISNLWNEYKKQYKEYSSVVKIEI
jgi:hypothetical protein